MSLRGDAKLAAERILGVEIYEAMRSARIGTPEIISQAGKKAFVEDLRGDDVETVRYAMKRLAETGILL